MCQGSGVEVGGHSRAKRKVEKSSLKEGTGGVRVRWGERVVEGRFWGWGGVDGRGW